LYLHGRLRSPILSLAIINNAGAILNSREWVEVTYSLELIASIA